LDKNAFLDDETPKWGDVYYNIRTNERSTLIGKFSLQNVANSIKKGFYNWKDFAFQFIEDTSNDKFSDFAKDKKFNTVLKCDTADKRTPYPGQSNRSPNEWIDVHTQSVTDNDDKAAVNSLDLYQDKHKYEYKICNYISCSPDYQWTEWTSDASTCSQSCLSCSLDANGVKICDTNSAYRVAYRSCRHKDQAIDDPTDYYMCAPDPTTGESNYKRQECDIPECPYVSNWQEWSSCSRTCGGGFRKRKRFCNLDLADNSLSIKDRKKIVHSLNLIDADLDDITDAQALGVQDEFDKLYTDYETSHNTKNCPSTLDLEKN